MLSATRTSGWPGSTALTPIPKEQSGQLTKMTDPFVWTVTLVLSGATLLGLQFVLLMWNSC